MARLTAALSVLLWVDLAAMLVGGVVYWFTASPWLGTLLEVNGFVFAVCALVAFGFDLVVRRRRG